MDITGYFASILIGVLLGLMGGGGSIFTVPVLVYFFSRDAESASTYSLFIVGVTSVIGGASYFKRRLVDTRSALVFGLPSTAAVLVTRAVILQAIPLSVMIGNFNLTRDLLLLLLFALLMLVAALSMIFRKENRSSVIGVQRSAFIATSIRGIGVGVVTGLVGAGGGFLIIPALVNLLKLPMKTAVGTSLFIISINSLTGFALSDHSQDLEWKMLFTITAMAVVGIFIGTYLPTKISGDKLKPAFGWFVLVMGIYIIIKETLV